MNELTLERHVPAAAGEVLACFVDAERMSNWFWPPRLAADVTLDPVVGGSWRVESLVAGMAVGGRYISVEPESRLELTWQWDGESEQTRVAITVAPDGVDSSIVTVEHVGFADVVARDDHIEGWNDCLDRLPAELSR